MVAHCDKLQVWDEMQRPYCLPLRAATCNGTLNVAKVQYKLHVASSLNLPSALVWQYGMEYGRKF